MRRRLYRLPGALLALCAALLIAAKQLKHFFGVEMDSGGHFHDILIQFGHHAVEVNPSATAVITGHSDSAGSAEVNNRMSMERADNAETYLVETHGIEGIVGKGQTLRRRDLVAAEGAHPGEQAGLGAVVGQLGDHLLEGALDHVLGHFRPPPRRSPRLNDST